MAKLDKNVFPGFERTYTEPEETCDEWLKRTDRLFDKICSNSILSAKANNPVGVLLKFPVADGYACYVVTKEKPLTLQHVPFGDSYKISDAHIKGLTISDVRVHMRSIVGYEKIAEEQKENEKKFKDGDIVHYHNGFNQFVRCEVTHTKSGELTMKPLALVGEWQSYDLPRRLKDGSVLYSYHAKKILEARNEPFEEVWVPSMSCVYEASGYSREHPFDPRECQPISLDVPDMTEEEKRLSDLWAGVHAIQGALSVQTDDPKGLLINVWKLANGVLEGGIAGNERNESRTAWKTQRDVDDANHPDRCSCKRCHM